MSSPQIKKLLPAIYQSIWEIIITFILIGVPANLLIPERSYGFFALLMIILLIVHIYQTTLRRYESPQNLTKKEQHGVLKVYLIVSGGFLALAIMVWLFQGRSEGGLIQIGMMLALTVGMLLVRPRQFLK